MVRALVFLALSVSSFSFAATEIIGCPDRYPNGQKLIDGDVLRYPNSNRLKDGDVWRYPNGNRVVDGTVWRYPNSNRIVDIDVWRFENNNRFRDGNILRYKSSNRFREPDGTFRAENGTKLEIDRAYVSEVMSQYGFVRFHATKKEEWLVVHVVYDGENSFELLYDPSHGAEPKSITCNVELQTGESKFTLTSPKAIIQVQLNSGVDAKAFKKKLQAVLDELK